MKIKDKQGNITELSMPFMLIMSKEEMEYLRKSFGDLIRDRMNKEDDIHYLAFYNEATTSRNDLLEFMKVEE
jgi:hypothetical protein